MVGNHLLDRKMRILFIGENWHGSNSTSFVRAFRFLGCDVLVVDERHFFPQWGTFPMKIFRRLLRPFIVRDFSVHIRDQARIFGPDLVFVFKGVMVSRSDLQYFWGLGAHRFLFYPDPDLISYYTYFGNDIWQCANEYDVFFTPKSNQIDILKANNVKRIEFLPYAYDPWCHFPVKLSQDEKTIYESDIVFIGTWGQRRAVLLEELVKYKFPYQLAIWGNYWEKLDWSSKLRRYVKGQPAYGVRQAKICAGTKIALAFLTPPDLHNARTFELPAYGAFMLAERTVDHQKFFIENKEIVCFSSPLELRQQIDHYIHDENERKRILEAGFRRVTGGGNSYIDRAMRVLEIYNDNKQ